MPKDSSREEPMVYASPGPEGEQHIEGLEEEHYSDEVEEEEPYEEDEIEEGYSEHYSEAAKDPSVKK